MSPTSKVKEGENGQQEAASKVSEKNKGKRQGAGKQSLEKVGRDRERLRET